MSSMSSFAQLVHGVLFAIGAILIISSTQKLRAPRQWVEDLSAYQMLPSQRFTSILAWTIIFVELGLGAVLILQLFPKGAALAAILLFCMFLGVTSLAIVQGRVVSCGCFGEISRQSLLGKQTVARLVVLTGTSGLSFIYISLIESLRSQDLVELIARIGSGIAFGTPLVLLVFLVELTQQILHMLKRSAMPVDTTSTKETTS